MATNDSEGSIGYEVVSDVLDGFDVTADERIRIEERTDQLLTLDALRRPTARTAISPAHSLRRSI